MENANLKNVEMVTLTFNFYVFVDVMNPTYFRFFLSFHLLTYTHFGHFRPATSYNKKVIAPW